jgi:tRNA 2-thiouridine synthesizing protein A
VNILEIEKLDVKGQMCPLPVAFTKLRLEKMASGQLLEVIGEGESEFDNIQRWVKNKGHLVIEALKSGNEFRILIKKQ